MLCFERGIILNSAVVDVAYSGGVSINASMRPFKTVSLCSSVVTTLSARVRNTSPLVVVWEIVCGDSSSFALSAPILLSRSAVALAYLV